MSEFFLISAHHLLRGLYAVRIAQGDPAAWREALIRLPEVEWAEVVSSVSFSPRIS